MEIVLGSKSPRRKEILEFFSIPFRQASPDYDESILPFEGDPASYALAIAENKALSLKNGHAGEIVLTADTVVYRQGRVFLKPESLEEACQMLRELSGKEHEVHTGVCVARGNEIFSAVEMTRVFFVELTDHQIRNYAHIFHPMDKAGGYAIQKGGSLIVKRIEGCYYNVMGLPLQTVRRLLLNVGVDLWDFFKPI